MAPPLNSTGLVIAIFVAYWVFGSTFSGFENTPMYLARKENDYSLYVKMVEATTAGI